MNKRILVTNLIMCLFLGFSYAQEPKKELPCIPEGQKSFRAYYTRLNYTKEWEQKWRVGEFADILVTFDNSDIGFIFWRGTNYIPQWITENGIWYNNQFVERRGRGIKETTGCVEPMSDKQCRYSHARIIENNEARKIIHWRYAPVDVEYNHPFVDSVTGWYDWVDEYYIIYPDAVATRSATLYSTGINEFADWQESIVVHQPGKSPEDNIEDTAVSISNLQGEVTHYSWPRDKSPLDGLPTNSCIQLVNTRSIMKPFIVMPPDTGLSIRAFRGQSPNTIYRHWDHWPVSQDKSWTRHALDNSTPSHTSLTYWKGWNPSATTENSKTYVMMHGMTGKGIEQLTNLAKSWLHPANINSISSGYVFDGYDRQQRAFSFTSATSNPKQPLQFKVEASKENPLHNPAFIIHNWGNKKAKIELEGSSQKIEDIRQDIEYDLDGNSLVIWLKTEVLKEVHFSISPIR